MYTRVPGNLYFTSDDKWNRLLIWKGRGDWRTNFWNEKLITFLSVRIWFYRVSYFINLDGLLCGKVLKEELLEGVRVDGLVWEGGIVGAEEGLELCTAAHQLLQVPEEGGPLLVGDGGEGVVRVNAAQVRHKARQRIVRTVILRHQVKLFQFF